MHDREAIRKNLVALGVGMGCKLIVHSSYRQIGNIDGGPQAFLDVLVDLVGNEGTILMPAFRDPTPFVLDHSNAPSECGIVTELFRRMDGTICSCHPTHPVAVRGRRAQEIAGKHETSTALGVHSPLHFFIEQGAEIFLVGVNHNRNSAIHVAERIFGVPYKDLPFDELFAKPVRVFRDGRLEDYVVQECPGCSEGFNAIESRLQRMGLIRTGHIGNAPSQVVMGTDLLNCALEMLGENVYSLLCSNPKCSFCRRARKTTT